MKGELFIMEKFLKRLLGITAIAAAVAGIIYFFKNRQNSEDDFFEDEFEDEDFDLDEDLKPAKDRGYVSLTPKAEEAEKTEAPEEAAKTEKEEEPENAEATDSQS